MMGRRIKCFGFSRMAAALALLATGGCGWMEWPADADLWGDRSVATAPASRAASPQVKPVPLAERPGSIIVARGDSVHRVSARYGIPARSIIEENNLQPPYRLYVGQRLVLPRGREYVVQAGDTLSQVALSQGVDMAILASANGLTRPYDVWRGQRLIIPSTQPREIARAPSRAPVQSGAVASQPSPVQASPLQAPPVRARVQAPAQAPTPAPVEAPNDSDAAGSARETTISALPAPRAATTTALAVPPADVGPPPRKTGGGFLWPVRGSVLSSFGSKGNGLRNDGINIAATRGTPVLAAETGVVAYAGNELKAFGNLVLIKHEGGWVTTYGHNQSLKVKRGDIVHKGQVIAEVGSSGSVSKPQLHFEIRKGRKAVDPRQHLPPTSA